MPYRGANECHWFEVQIEHMEEESDRFLHNRRLAKAKHWHFDFIMTRTIITFQPKNLSMTVFHKLDACSCHLMQQIKVKIYWLVMQRFRLVCQLEYPRVTCIFSVYIRAFRRACLSRKDKWQVGYSMVYHQKASHDYFIPCHRKYSGQHKKWEIRADKILNCFELASYCIRWWQRFKRSKVFY